MKTDDYSLAFSHNNKDFQDPQGIDLLARTEPFYEWQDNCQRLDLWTYGNRALHSAPKTTTSICDGLGVLTENAINLGSQDYLSLANNERIKEVAIATIRDYGVHSAGSAAVMGNTDISLRLESALADFLQTEHVTLYPTGWAAGYGAIRGLVREHDYIVMDELSHNCLKEGAFAATKKISNFKHLDFEQAEKLLRRIRKQDTKNGILLITESLFSMDSDTPDIAKFQGICHEYQATLFVDVAHDLGAMGDDGTGALGIQNMLGKVDIVMGSFSKTFASNGGFVATRSRAVKQYLKSYSPSHTFSNALSPAQAATILEALNIVTSPLGQSLRLRLMDNIVLLRNESLNKGMMVSGIPSPIVPILISEREENKKGNVKARLVSRHLPSLGVLANVVGYPAVPLGLTRIRLQVMAEHTSEMMMLAADKLSQAMSLAEDELNDII